MEQLFEGGVRILYCLNGLTLLGRVDVYENLPGAFVISNPVMIEIHPNNIMKFVPFLSYSAEYKTGIAIDIKSIMLVTTPVDDLLKKYEEINSSIIRPSSLVK